MKKLLAALLCAFAFSAYAAGQYDGIYQSTTSSDTYASVHQNGNVLIIALFDGMTSSGTTRFNTPFGSITPSRLDYWDLYQGTISGSSAQIMGQTTFTGCNEIVSLEFDESGATATYQAFSNTAAGNRAGMQCGAGVPIGTTARLIRVF